MIKFLSEIAPLIAFFAGYKYGGIQAATFVMLIVAVICLLINLILKQKIPIFSLISTGFLVVSGSIALISGNSVFIKIKPTILYTVFGLGLLISALRKKPFLKVFLSNIMNLRDKDWISLSYRFAIFFILMAVMNEIIWRNFDEASWVKFKVFGALPITLLFILFQIPFLMKNRLPDSDLPDSEK